MIDWLNLTDVILINSTSLQPVTDKINALITIFNALGGIFIFWIIINILRWREARKQRKMLEEVKADLKKLVRKKK